MIPALSDKKMILALMAATAILIAGVYGLSIPRQYATRTLELPAAQSESTGRHARGPIIPGRALPPVNVALDDGSKAMLSDILTGRWTYLQLMFTGCSTTCPIQGAIFARTQVKLREEGLDAQLLSFSVDPLGDDAPALKRWLHDFDAGTGWRAAVPSLDQLGPLLDTLNGRGRGVDLHEARVYLIDPDARLIYITEEMPSPAGLVDLLKIAQEAAASAA